MRRPSVATTVVVQPDANVFADNALTRLALTALIENAFKFSEKVAAPKVEIGVFEQDEVVVVYVRDNGVGFETSKMVDGLDAFQRFHSDSEFEGVGIGLATARQVARRDRGRLWLESTVGQGTTAYLIV